MCVRACNEVFSLGVVLLSVSITFFTKGGGGSLARECEKGADQAGVEAGLEPGLWVGADGEGEGEGVGGHLYQGFPEMVRPPHRPVCV